MIYDWLRNEKEHAWIYHTIRTSSDTCAFSILMRFVSYSTDANDSENEESVGTPSLTPEDETFFGMCVIFI